MRHFTRLRVMSTNKMADYDGVSRGSLKLKGAAGSSIKKKKKRKDKERDMKKMLEQISTTGEGSSEGAPKVKKDKRTPAEIAFEKKQAKRKAELILEKASKTHKERIIEFNKHLDTLTEHFDIPKVSWTK